jgi:hypothetical protein
VKRNILRAPNWTKRSKLCKEYGFRAAIVYEQNLQFGGGLACHHRLTVKEFLNKKFGPPMSKDWYGKWVNTDGEWLAGVTKKNEYTIAVKDPKLRDWLLLL